MAGKQLAAAYKGRAPAHADNDTPMDDGPKRGNFDYTVEGHVAYLNARADYRDNKNPEFRRNPKPDKVGPSMRWRVIHMRDGQKTIEPIIRYRD